MSDWLKEHAEYAEKIIATWPEWKKGLLEHFSQPIIDTPRPFVDNHGVLCSGDRSKPVGEPGLLLSEDAQGESEMISSRQLLRASSMWYPVMLAAERGEISEAKAAELLGMNIEQYRERRDQAIQAVMDFIVAMSSPLMSILDVMNQRPDLFD